MDRGSSSSFVRDRLECGKTSYGGTNWVIVIKADRLHDSSNTVMRRAGVSKAAYGMWRR